MVAPLIDRNFLLPSDLTEDFRLKLSAPQRDGYDMRLGDFLDYLGITPTVCTYGAVGDGVTDDSDNLLLSDATSDAENLFPAGTYYIANSISLTKPCRFMPGAVLSIASGKTVTFKGNVTAGMYQIFSGSGVVYLGESGTYNCQRAPVYFEWWGAKADGSTDCYSPIAKCLAACVCGALVFAANGVYSTSGGWTISNRVNIYGQSNGINPQLGGTLFIPTVAVAYASTSLFTLSAGSLKLQDFMILGPSTTSPLLAYTGIKTLGTIGKSTFNNIEINGCGTGFDFAAGAGAECYTCRVYQFTLYGMKFGGVASSYSGPIRFFGGIINNPNTTTTLAATMNSGSTTMTLDSATVSAIVVGMGISAFYLPVSTTVVQKLSATTIQVSAAATATMATGKYVRYGYFLSGTCLDFGRNSFDINFKDMELAGGAVLVSITGTTDTGNGWYRPNNIVFDNLNATASTYYGVYITSGTDIQFNNTWIGDVPFGATMQIDAVTASDIDTITMDNTLIGNAGTYCLYANKFTNLLINFCRFPGACSYTDSTNAAVYIGSGARGQFMMIASYAGKRLMNVIGVPTYGLEIQASALAGTGDSINVSGNNFSGSTGGYTDGSSPSGTAKVFANNCTT